MKASARTVSTALLAFGAWAVALEAQPQVMGVGMTQGIGDDFLGAAQQHLRTARIAHREARGQLQMDGQAGDTFDQGFQGLGQVDRVVLAQLADHFTYVRKQ